jgi:hypothetical protein
VDTLAEDLALANRQISYVAQGGAGSPAPHPSDLADDDTSRLLLSSQALRSQLHALALVDPLARVFMDRTKGCTYKEQRLHGRPVRVLNVPAESLSLTHVADTLVMVSVLQSVRDVPAVLQVSEPPECV